MRKEGGDKWLAMLNAEREQQLSKVHVVFIMTLGSLPFH